uniref:Uncharacterized protein n=1 Tax=Lotharella globosa TaxID=91324 RepID=A0A7S3Z947_9EUKA|eukprot:CAMPEP_0167826464 /NCGR_PEP_ID=MMETSP0112_2-20121227/10046_1 /TAXON_ID=91324 /ORGANISM="Lotharella globosa, Strain CCCM811" /LENGTH=232 /DNA_ID=CAMNT_0007728905 /DNA_START=42 /DNA_END=740 /DNA_ORIENTATION=-
MAKKQFFLKPADLAKIPSYKRGGWGCGNMKLFKTSDLCAYVLTTYGEAWLQKKIAAREKREQRKRKRVEEAKQAEEELKKKVKALGDITSSASNAANIGIRKASASEINQIRKEVKKAFKPLMTWEHMREKRAPNGCMCTARVYRVDQAIYAALIGKPHDPMLKSCVKLGAWYSEWVEADTVFGGMALPRGSGGRYNSNSQLGISTSSSKLEVKYCPSNKTLSVSAYVCQDY